MQSIHLCVLFISAVLCATTVKAAPYQYEFVIGFSDIQYFKEAIQVEDSFERFDQTDDYDSRQARLTYYPVAIVAQKGPLAERAFLSKTGSFTGSFTNDSYNIEGDYETLGLEGRYITPNNLIIGVSYEKQESEGSLVEQERRDTGVELGTYLSDTSSVSLSVNSITSQFDESPTGGISYTNSYKSYGIAYKQLFNSATPNRYLAYGLNLNYSDTDFGRSMQVDLNSSYYLSQRLSLGAGVSYVDADRFNVSRATFGTEYFVSEQFLTSLSLTRQLDADRVQLDTINIKIGARF